MGLNWFYRVLLGFTESDLVTASGNRLNRVKPSLQKATDQFLLYCPSNPTRSLRSPPAKTKEKRIKAKQKKTKTKKTRRPSISRVSTVGVARKAFPPTRHQRVNRKKNRIMNLSHSATVRLLFSNGADSIVLFRCFFY